MKVFSKNIKGAATIEAAFLFPVFFLFILGMIYFSYSMMIRNNMQYGLQVAARYAMINTSATDNQIITTAKNNMISVDVNNVTVTITTQAVNGINSKIITSNYSLGLPSILGVVLLNLSTNITVPI